MTQTITKASSHTITAYKSQSNYEGLSVTREEYLDLPDDGKKYDMIGGILYMAPSASFGHGEACIDFAIIIKKYLESHDYGRVVSEIDVFLPDGGDVLRPDISFIRHERMQIVKTHIHGVPDLICEILSPATRQRDLGEKADRYLANAVKEYWIIDPDARTISCWYNKGSEWEKAEGGSVDSRLLDGFRVEAKRMFG